MGFGRYPNTVLYVNQNDNSVAIADRSLSAIFRQSNVRCVLYCRSRNMLQNAVIWSTQKVIINNTPLSETYQTFNKNHKHKPASTGERWHHTISLKVMVGQGNTAVRNNRWYNKTILEIFRVFWQLYNPIRHIRRASGQLWVWASREEDYKEFCRLRCVAV
jgi:hypothetical protein